MLFFTTNSFENALAVSLRQIIYALNSLTQENKLPLILQKCMREILDYLRTTKLKHETPFNHNPWAPNI